MGWNTYPMAGNEISQAFQDLNGSISKMVVTVFTPVCRTAWAGDCVSFEYSLYDGLSLGMKTNLVQMLVSSIRDGLWNVQGALFTNVNINTLFAIPSEFPLIFLWNEEIQVAPVYTTNPSFGDGLVNLFTTLSSNYRIVDTDNFDLNVYLDLKVITSFPHPYYTFRWMTKNFYVDAWTGSGWTMTPDFEVVLCPGTKLATAIGFDMVLFKNILCFIGINLPIASFSRNMDDSTGMSWELPVPVETLVELSRWEFELKFKL